MKVRNRNRMKYRAIRLGMIILALALALAGCATGGKTPGGDEKKVKLGILQMMAHASLDQAREGFLAALKEGGYEEGKNLIVDYQNGQGERSNMQTMSERLVANSDIILTIATPAAQAMVEVGPKQPVLFTAVTNPVSAGLIASMEKPGGLVTGTSDMAPIADQVALLLGIKPDIKTVGLIYNLGEQNSVEQIDMAKAALAKAGVKVVEMTVTSTNDVEQMMTNLAKQVDGIYIPTDNTLAAAAQTVGEVAREYKVPVVAGSVSQVEEGGLATYGIDYYQLGLQTGRQALKLKVLGGTAEPKDVPAEYPKDLSLEVNEEMAAALGIDPKSIKSGK